MVLREREAVDYLERMKLVMGGEGKRLRFSNLELLKSMTFILKGFVESFPGEVGSYVVDVTGFPEILAWVSDVKRAIAMYGTIQEGRRKSAMPLLEQYAVGQVRGIADEGSKLSKQLEKDWAMVQAVGRLERGQREFLARLQLGRSLSQTGEKILIYSLPSAPGVLVMRDSKSVFQASDAGDDRNAMPEFAGVKYIDPVVWSGEQKWVPWMSYFPIKEKRWWGMAVWSTRSSKGIWIDVESGARMRSGNKLFGMWGSGYDYDDDPRYKADNIQLTQVGQTELADELARLYAGSDLRHLSAVAAIKWFENLAEFSGLMKQLEAFLVQVVEGRLTNAREMRQQNESLMNRLQAFYANLGEGRLESEYRMVQAVVVNRIRVKQETPKIGDIGKGGVSKGLRVASDNVAQWWREWW